MGGFEGGDEGGFWDIDAIDVLITKQNSPAPKSSQEIKITIERENSAYKIKNNPNISFVPHECTSFTIEGCESIPLESNTIYQTYKALLKLTCDSDIEDFFREHKVVVDKYKPSSNTSFLLLTKELCNLVLSESELETLCFIKVA